MESEVGVQEKFDEVERLGGEGVRLSNERQAIPLEIQEDFRGRGTTAAGIAPIQTSRLNNNAIQVLSNNTSLDSAIRSLESANRFVEDSLAAKYNPIREQLAFEESLIGVQKERLAQVDEKKRVKLEAAIADREELLNTEKERVAKEEQEDQEILNIVVQAINSGASGADLVAIQNANSVEEALRVAQPFLGLSFRQDQEDRNLDRQAKQQQIRSSQLRDSIAIKEFNLAQVAAQAERNNPAIKSAQALAAGYATRIDDANGIIDELDELFTSRTRAIGRTLNPIDTTSERRYDQASRNFINAILRRESGAAIAKEEFESAELQYLPVTGDGETVLEQKKTNRQVALAALQAEAGEDALAEVSRLIQSQRQQALFDAEEQSLLDQEFGVSGSTDAFVPSNFFD